MATNLHASICKKGGSRTAPTGNLYNIALACLGNSMGHAAAYIANETLQVALWDHGGNEELSTILLLYYSKSNLRIGAELIAGV